MTSSKKKENQQVYKEMAVLGRGLEVGICSLQNFNRGCQLMIVASTVCS